MDFQVSIRDVQKSDLLVFYEQQRDPEANQMADFPARDYEAFMTHWRTIIIEPTAILRTVIANGEVAGNIVVWEAADESNVGYWLGKEYWGRGIASAALKLLLHQVEKRPLFAHVTMHNVASQRVLQKCGFTKHRDGRYSDANGIEREELIMVLKST